MGAEDEMPVISDIKGRLEFFFSDANIRQDRFIRKLLLDKEGDDKGMVPIESLLKFNTIKKYTEKTEIVAKAAKELPDLLILNEDETAIGRKVEFTEEMMNDNIPKSLYVTKLPMKENEDGRQIYSCAIDEVKALFEKYGKVALVRLMWGSRKHKQPDGAAMVEFAKKEDLDKAVAAVLTIKEGSEIEAAEKLTLGDSTLGVMLFSEFVEKKGDKKSGKKRERNGDGGAKESKTFTYDWKPGCVIKMKGLPDGCNREAILDAIALQMDISVTEVKNQNIYADFSIGQTNGYIRFPEPGDHIGEMAKRLKSGELQVAGCKIEGASMLAGEDEKKYFDDFIEFKNKQIRNRDENKRSRKRGRHGGHSRN